MSLDTRNACWAWMLALTYGPANPGLVTSEEPVTYIDAFDINGPTKAPHCPNPGAYDLDLDMDVWLDSKTTLCVAHAARIRALPHGGILGIRSLAVAR